MRLDAAFAHVHGAGRAGDVGVLPDTQRKGLALTVRQGAQGGFEPRQRLATLGLAIRAGRRIARQTLQRIGFAIVCRAHIGVAIGRCLPAYTQ